MLRKRTRSLERKCEDLEDEIAALDDVDDIQKEKDAFISNDGDWMEEESEEAPNTDDDKFIDDRDETEL